jgi:DNA-binding FrmR family transcriptional regulator
VILIIVVALELLSEHARHCLNNGNIGLGSEVKADELVAAIGRMLKS